VKVLIVFLLIVEVVLLGSAAIRGGSDRDPRVWTIDWGKSLTLPRGRLHPDDTFRCKNGAGVNGVPMPGHGVGNSLGLSVSTAEDGSVTASCDPNSKGAQY